MATYIKPDAIKDNSLSINKIDNVALDLADKVNALSDEGKNTFLNKIGLGKIGVISQTQTWTQAADNGYDYVMSDLVRGIIPQANIDLLASIGIVFNEESGYFELDRMTDLSYEEIMVVYNITSDFSKGNVPSSGVGLGGVFQKEDAIYRCNIPLLLYRTYMLTNSSFNYLCWNNRYIERLFLSDKYMVSILGIASIFENCYRLKEVQGVIGLGAPAKNYTSAFLNCYSLESVSLKRIKANLNFAQSARLNNASILFMINNEEATSPITITLHADVYNRCMANADILAALETHTNISLASA